MRRWSPPQQVDRDRMISLPTCVSSAPHRNTWDLSVPGSLCWGNAADPAKLTEQVEQQQHAPKDRIGGVEVLEAESVRSQIVFEFGDSVFHVGAVIVVSPDLFRQC